MDRYARFQLSLEQTRAYAAGVPITLRAFGGCREKVEIRSMRPLNVPAWNDHLVELRIGGKRVVLSASELIQALGAA